MKNFLMRTHPLLQLHRISENLCRNLNRKIQPQLKLVRQSGLLLAEIRLGTLKLYLMVSDTRTLVGVEMNLHLTQPTLPHICLDIKFLFCPTTCSNFICLSCNSCFCTCHLPSHTVLLGKLRSFGSLSGRGSYGGRIFRFSSRASTASTIFAVWTLNF